MEDTYQSLQNAIVKETLWLSIAIALLALAFGYKPLTKGIILGTLFSVLDFKLMARSLRKRIQSPSRLKFTGNLLGRLLIMAIPLIIALKFPYLINVIAVIVGLLLVKITILLRYLVFRKEFPLKMYKE